LADHQPVEQHAHGKLLLDRRRLHRGLSWPSKWLSFRYGKMGISSKIHA
jgi:hypothetical protein